MHLVAVAGLCVDLCCTFAACLLQGRTAQRFRTVITLGVLSFNKYQPTDLKVRGQGTRQAGQRCEACSTGWCAGACALVEQWGWMLRKFGVVMPLCGGPVVGLNCLPA